MQLSIAPVLSMGCKMAPFNWAGTVTHKLVMVLMGKTRGEIDGGGGPRDCGEGHGQPYSLWKSIMKQNKIFLNVKKKIYFCLLAASSAGAV